MASAVASLCETFYKNFVAIFVVILALSGGFWFLVFNKRARGKVLIPWWPSIWKRRLSIKEKEEVHDLEEGFALICYLLAAMICTIIWITALVVFILRVVG